jgi:hypothetical protein
MNNLDRDKNKHLKSFQDIKKKKLLSCPFLLLVLFLKFAHCIFFLRLLVAKLLQTKVIPMTETLLLKNEMGKIAQNSASKNKK